MLLQIGLHRRYNPLYLQILELVEGGEFGEVKMVWCQEFRGDWAQDSFVDHPKHGKVNWRLWQNLSGGSLVEKNCHDFDVFNWQVGARPLRVSAFGGKGVHQDRDTIDHAVVIVEYENAAKGMLQLCLFVPYGRNGRHTGLVGDKGSLDIFEKRMEMYQYSRADGRVIHHKFSEDTRGHGTGVLNEHRAFVDCIRERKKPFADGQVGRESVEVALAAQQAIEEGQVVCLDR